MLEKLSGNNIILASQSPRRHFLLKQLGIEFNIISNSSFNEDYPDDLEGGDIVEYLALQKANHCASQLNDNDLLITADTIVVYKERVLNKPVNKQEAIEMLYLISGEVHSVLTGVCLMTKKKVKTFFVDTRVYFKDLTSEEIEYYIEKYEPYDKAGAYGIQEWIGYIGVEKIEGSYFNVMGLPVQKLYEELQIF